jgi:hypothetical protein
VGGSGERLGSFEGLYRRLGRRYLLLLFVGAGASIPVLTVLVAALAVPYLDLRFSSFVASMLIVVPWMAGVAAVNEILLA